MEKVAPDAMDDELEKNLCKIVYDGLNKRFCRIGLAAEQERGLDRYLAETNAIVFPPNSA